MQKKYTVMWIVWILAFIGIEAAALRSDKLGDTLSEHVREWIGTGNPARTWSMWILRILTAGGLIWLIPHFLTGSI